MKKKLIYVVLLLVVISFTIGIITYDNNPQTELDIKKQELINSIPKEERFKRDMLEGLLEFADEDTPIDSLDIPDWIFN